MNLLDLWLCSNLNAYRVDPTDPNQRGNFNEALVMSAYNREAIAPMWEVLTAKIQGNSGAPNAGLSEEERAAKAGWNAGEGVQMPNMRKITKNIAYLQDKNSQNKTIIRINKIAIKPNIMLGCNADGTIKVKKQRYLTKIHTSYKTQWAAQGHQALVKLAANDVNWRMQA